LQCSANWIAHTLWPFNCVAKGAFSSANELVPRSVVGVNCIGRASMISHSNITKQCFVKCIEHATTSDLWKSTLHFIMTNLLLIDDTKNTVENVGKSGKGWKCRKRGKGEGGRYSPVNIGNEPLNHPCLCLPYPYPYPPFRSVSFCGAKWKPKMAKNW